MRMSRVVLTSSLIILIAGCAGIEVSAAEFGNTEQKSNTSYGHYYYDGQRYYRPQKSEAGDKMKYPLHGYWRQGSYGHIPYGAVVFGHHDGQPVYRCLADYGQGHYVGKAYSGYCYIRRHGTTIGVPRYKVYVEGY